MRGEILNFDEVSGVGLISGDDGQRYEFNVSDVQAGAPAAAKRVDFVAIENLATQIMILAAAPQPAADLSATAASGEAIDWQKLFISFDGRIRRSHFGIAWLILFAAGFIAGLLPLIGGLISLALIWPNLAIAVKRLHDMGKTGWLAAIPYAVMLIGFIAAFSTVGLTALTNLQGMENEDPATIMAIVGPLFGIFSLVALVGIGFLLWIGLTPGQRGSNRFGPNPKGE
jgi:uncharacterized membrane protein YhaH (DUF805 family)